MGVPAVTRKVVYPNLKFHCLSLEPFTTFQVLGRERLRHLPFDTRKQLKKFQDELQIENSEGVTKKIRLK